MRKPIDLTEMSLPHVISQMVSGSGKPAAEIAAEVGWSPSVASRIFNPAEEYWPSLPMAPAFCVACGSSLLIDWQVCQAEAGGVRFEHPAMDWQDLLLTLTDLEKELGDVAEEVRQDIEPDPDGKRRIDRTEAKRIIREVQDVITKGVALINGVRPMAGCSGEDR